MKSILIIILTIFHFCAFSQNEVKGLIKDIEGNVFPGVGILENGTKNSTTTDIEGRFQMTTIQDTCTISFSSIGYDTKTITVTKDTTINIILEVWNYESNWLTIGSSYDAFNSTFGFLVSNGFDEHPLIHFENFSESWIYKVSGSTNFNKDYSIGFKFAHDYVFRYIYMPTIEYRKTRYSSNAFHHTDLNLSFGFAFRGLGGSTFLLKSGYQELNGENNLGAGIGLQNSHRSPDLYYGFMIGFWTHYLTYNVFFQSFIFTHKLSLRANYERIENFDFLNLGINYLFNR